MENSQIRVQLQDWMGSDRAIANAAWTSSTEDSKKELKTDDDVRRVVKMLADLSHSVPFESVIFRFHFRLPVAIDRQLVTHRIGSHSGMSGRYRTMPREFLTLPNDVWEILYKAYGELGARQYEEEYNLLCEEANSWYEDRLSDLKEKVSSKVIPITNAEYKRAREFLRGVLPQHNMTERVSIFNLRSFANLYRLRSKPDAQPEFQFIAKEMLRLVKEANICPLAIAALEENEWRI